MFIPRILFSVLLNKEDLDYYSTNMNLPNAARAIREAGTTIRWAIGADKLSAAKMVTGGRSTGKSLLFSSILSEEQARPEKPLINMVRVDSRANPDMLKAINCAICTPSSW